MSELQASPSNLVRACLKREREREREGREEGNKERMVGRKEDREIGWMVG